MRTSNFLHLEDADKSVAELISDGNPTFFQCDCQIIPSSLLVHASPSIRIAALSTLIYSPSSTKPFTPELLHCLRQNLPIFHGESDPKIRGEFISSTKALIARLQAATFRLGKFLESHTGITQSQDEPVGSNESRDPSDDDHREDLGQHVSFLSWYIEFLSGELQPTASYQRHITALKVLQNMKQVIQSSHLQVRDPSVAYITRLNVTGSQRSDSAVAGLSNGSVR